MQVAPIRPSTAHERISAKRSQLTQDLRSCLKDRINPSASDKQENLKLIIPLKFRFTLFPEKSSKNQL